VRKQNSSVLASLSHLLFHRQTELLRLARTTDPATSSEYRGGYAGEALLEDDDDRPCLSVFRKSTLCDQMKECFLEKKLMKEM